MPIIELFREHPASVGETYGQHLRYASGFGVRMILELADGLARANTQPDS